MQTRTDDGVPDLARSQNARAGGKAAYAEKVEDYFSGARRDWIDALPINPSAIILELGCGTGSTGALALAEGKCARYCGIEISEQPAARASLVLSEVVVGDVESIALPWASGSFDALLMSEVLEHLVDPWAVLAKLRPLLKPGALVRASSPNVSHINIIKQLLRGRWDLTDSGPMDRTHLRWFTPVSYRQLFETTGFVVDRSGSMSPLSTREKWLCRLAGGRGEHLFAYQIDLSGHVAS